MNLIGAESVNLLSVELCNPVTVELSQSLLTLIPSVSLQASAVSELQQDGGAAAAQRAHSVRSLPGLRLSGPPPSDPLQRENMDGLRLPPVIEEVLDPSGQSVYREGSLFVLTVYSTLFMTNTSKH